MGPTEVGYQLTFRHLDIENLGRNFKKLVFLGIFFADFRGKSLFLGQKWGLVCKLAGLGRYRQEKCVEKRRNISINFNKFGKIQLF